MDKKEVFNKVCFYGGLVVTAIAAVGGELEKKNLNDTIKSLQDEVTNIKAKMQ